MIIWLQFIACTAIIFFSGTKLSKYGDIIAEKTGLGRTWIGVILIASVTSLPELITGISSVTIFYLPDIAAGDVVGSCMFNLLIIAMLDSMGDSLPISTRAHQGHMLSAGFGILLLGLVSISLFVGARFPSIGWIGAYSFVFLGLYLLAIRMIFLHEKKRIAEFVKEMAEELH
jgi:cation:H+ antiporter